MWRKEEGFGGTLWFRREREREGGEGEGREGKQREREPYLVGMEKQVVR